MKSQHVLDPIGFIRKKQTRKSIYAVELCSPAGVRLKIKPLPPAQR